MQAELGGFGELVEQRATEVLAAGTFADHAGAGQRPSGLYVTAMLWAAIIEAANRGLRRVVWPAHAGVSGGAGEGKGGGEPDLAQVGDIVDRAALVSHLAAVDGGAGAGSAIKVEAPFADMTLAQLADLAIDMDAPLWACWRCDRDGETGCGTCGRCKAFLEAVESASPGATKQAGGKSPITAGRGGLDVALEKHAAEPIVRPN